MANHRSSFYWSQLSVLRVRPDLVVRRQRFGKRVYWGIKDPVSLNYFHLLEEEYAILQWIDGNTSLNEIKQRFEKHFTPLQLSLKGLQVLLARFHRYGLLLSEAPGQGEQLLKRSCLFRNQQRVRAALNPLAIRFRGFDPEPLLGWLYPKCRFLFSAWAVVLVGLLTLGSLALAVVQLDTLQTKFPDVHTLLNYRNAFWLAMTLAGVKMLHELAHGLACKHFGGECHELGIMLLVFTPCLYCNVSDSWRLSSKWQRIAVAVAGIYVEVAMSSLAMFGWWFSHPGLFNMLCLNVIVICSLGTLLFNGNPLLKYDGYFVLSDLIEVPNLWERSRTIVRGTLARVMLGWKLEKERALPERYRSLLALYAICSTLYRWAVLLTILWFLQGILADYQLAVVAQIITVFVLANLVSAPILGVVRFLRDPLAKRHIHGGRLVLSAITFAAIFWFICFVPVRSRVVAPVVLEYVYAQRVYVTVPGILLKQTTSGEAVRQGQILAQLKNLQLNREVQELIGDRNQQQLHLANLELQRSENVAAGARIPVAREALSGIEGQLSERQRDQRCLILRAPVAGTVLPPPYVPPQPRPFGQLVDWSGTPLDAGNLGCYLETGTLFCLIGDPQDIQPVLLIDQADVGLVRLGAEVRLRLKQTPGKILEGTVEKIDLVDLKVAPRQLIAEGELSVHRDEHGVVRPIDTYYQARVKLKQPPKNLLVGTRGRAKIEVLPRSLGEQVYRFLTSTFRFVH